MLTTAWTHLLVQLVNAQHVAKHCAGTAGLSLLMIRSMHFRTTGLSVNAGLLERRVQRAGRRDLLGAAFSRIGSLARRPAWAGPAWTPQLGLGSVTKLRPELAEFLRKVNVARQSPSFSILFVPFRYSEIIAR